MAPVGTGAAAFLLPAIASHYGVGATGVMWVNGLGGGALLTLGSLAATLVPGDLDRRVMYAVAGFVNALATLLLLIANQPSVYFAGTALYLATNGFCAAWFTALQVEIVGRKTRDASTLYSILNSAGSLPIIYMTSLDGVGYSKFGTSGLLLTDAIAGLVVCAVVAVVLLTGGMSIRRVSPPRESGAF